MTKGEIRNWTYLEIQRHPDLAQRPVYGMAFYRTKVARSFVSGVQVTYSRSMIERWLHEIPNETVQDDGEGVL